MGLHGNQEEVVELQKNVLGDPVSQFVEDIS